MVDARVLLDELEIKRLRQRWAFGRDYGEWDEIAACFHPNAHISISWYEGNVAGFIEGSRASMASLKPDERIKHWLGNARVWMEGDRGIAEVDVMISARNFVDGYLFDITTWARFCDFVERRGGEWKISQWKMIYDADRMDAVEPSRVPIEYFETMDLSTFPPACGHLCYRLARSGRDISKKIIGRNTDAERELKIEAKRWLEGESISANEA